MKKNGKLILLILCAIVLILIPIILLSIDRNIKKTDPDDWTHKQWVEYDTVVYVVEGDTIHHPFKIHHIEFYDK